ncbi:MAG: hypothetical protein M1836_008155 [Candelina mexicana]|nr:MAG: hypothetical protein M1836_008155 [Candelina mexicana]
MKSFTLSATTIALLATLSSAVPTTPPVVNIELEIESDTFIQDTVPFNVLFKTANNRRLASGLDATIQGTKGIPDDSKVACQAFDANNKPLGGPFTKENEATFSTNGQAVPIAAYLCSNMNAQSPRSDTGDNKAFAANTGIKSSARIQLEFESDGFIQGEVPIGQLFLTKNDRRFQRGLDASVVSATGVDVKRVKCQAFSDEQGRKALGNAFTNTVDGVFTKDSRNPVAIAAFKCNSN